jgi:hypothetical protein
MPRVRIGPALQEQNTLDIEIARLRDLDVGELRARSHAGDAFFVHCLPRWRCAAHPKTGIDNAPSLRVLRFLGISLYRLAVLIMPPAIAVTDLVALNDIVIPSCLTQFLVGHDPDRAFARWREFGLRAADCPVIREKSQFRAQHDSLSLSPRS